MTTERTTQQTDLRSIFTTLRRRKWIIVACVVVAAGAVLGFSLAQQKKYSATATLLFRAPGFDQTVFGAQVFQQTDPTREAATNVDLVSLEAVAAKTADKVDQGMTASEVSSEVSVSAEGQSDLVSITATDPDPAFSAQLANAFADSFVAFRRDADRRKVANALTLVRKDYNDLSPARQASKEGQNLQQQMSQLSTLKALQTGNAEVVQRASPPTSPSSPQPARNTILAAGIGLLLGLALAFLFDRLDRRVRDPDDLENTLSMPMLGSVPESKALAETGNGSVAQLPFAETEAFRMLRTRLRYFNVDREVRSVLVTSASPRDGKSTVAWYMAQTAASSGVRTLLIEADFHQPTVAGRQGLDPLPGLAEVLTHQTSHEDAMQHVPLGEGGNGTSQARGLDVLVAGATPPNPAELLESHEMASLLAAMTEEYSLVIVDTPPVSVLADAIPLMKLVGGVLVVGQLGKTTRDEAGHLAEQLRALDAPILGVVANRAGKRRGYGYRYGYGYQGYYGDGEQAPGRGIKIGRRS